METASSFPDGRTGPGLDERVDGGDGARFELLCRSHEVFVKFETHFGNTSASITKCWAPPFIVQKNARHLGPFATLKVVEPVSHNGRIARVNWGVGGTWQNKRPPVSARGSEDFLLTRVIKVRCQKSLCDSAYHLRSIVAWSVERHIGGHEVARIAASEMDIVIHPVRAIESKQRASDFGSRDARLPETGNPAVLGTERCAESTIAHNAGRR